MASMAEIPQGTPRASVRSMARVSRRVFAAFGALVVGGCLSPTLPLPPPSKPTVEGPDQEGKVKLTGRVQAGADVFAANNRTDEVVGQMELETGDYVLFLTANVGDELMLWYAVGTELSSSVIFTVPAPPP
jgi:hypothetical protein